MKIYEEIKMYEQKLLCWDELSTPAQFTYKLLGRVKDYTHELSDDNPIKSLAKKYIWAERLMNVRTNGKEITKGVVGFICFTYVLIDFSNDFYSKLQTLYSDFEILLQIG